jgi:hypothetical protein
MLPREELRVKIEVTGQRSFLRQRKSWIPACCLKPAGLSYTEKRYRIIEFITC